MNNTVQDFLALNKDFCFHTLKVGLHNTEYTPCAGLLCLERYCAGFYCGKILLELFFLFPLSLCSVTAFLSVTAFPLHTAFPLFPVSLVPSLFLFPSLPSGRAVDATVK